MRDARVSDSSDEAVVRAAQAGDRTAFGILYERYARMVHGVLLARVPALAVEDLAQDVFLRAADFFRQSQGEAVV